MTPNYMSSTQNPAFLAGSSTIENHDQHFHHQFFSPSFHHQLDASSSSHHSFHFYFNPTQHQDGYNYHTESVTQPQHQFDQVNNGSGVAFDGSYDYSHHPLENKVGKGLKISLGCNKESKHEIVGDQEVNNDVGNISSPKLKVKMMHNKMKKSDHNKGGGEIEDSQKIPFNNNNDHGSSNCSLYNNSNITPVRVCSDCNTTKTPLWRSGPKGPKSLCNACGIRQRKARRALAEAAAADAAANGPPLLSSTETTPSPPPPSPPTTTKVKIKVNPQKEKSSKNNYSELSTVPFKKRCRVTTTTDNNESSAVGSSSSDQEPPAPVNGFEDFLINIKNKLGFHHVFPQDEKEAAILLMALSCGLVHG